MELGRVLSALTFSAAAAIREYHGEKNVSKVKRRWSGGPRWRGQAHAYRAMLHQQVQPLV